MTCKFCKKPLEGAGSICDVCDAKSWAKLCGKIIVRYMSKYRNEAEQYNSLEAKNYLTESLNDVSKIIKKQFDREGESVDWQDAFDKEVDRLTDYLTSLKEDTKKRDLNY